MSGNLRLNGTTSGYSELTAPEVAGDQTFTFPAVGGVLATTPTSGPVAAYQQGIWLPTIAAQGKNDPVANNSGVWAWEGVPNSTTGPGGPTPYISADTCTHTWWRIGNAVTLQSYVMFRATDPNNNAALEWRRLPYQIAPPIPGQTYNPFTGTSQSRGTRFSPSTNPGISCSFNPYFWRQTGQTVDDIVSMYYINGTITATNTGQSVWSSDVNRGMNADNQDGYVQWQATYLTDNTDWIPQNGATLA